MKRIQAWKVTIRNHVVKYDTHTPPHPKLENGSLEKIIKAVIADEDSRFNIQCLTLPLSISVNPPASFLFLFLKNLSQVNFQIPLQVSPLPPFKT